MRPGALVLAAAAVALLTLPQWIAGVYYLNIASQILVWAIFALGLNVLVGYAGLVSLGQAGLFGASCYAIAWLLAHGAGQGTAAAAALVVTAAMSAVFATLSLRATGIGFLMITLALGEILWGIAYRWISFTGGDNGISIVRRPAPFGVSLEGPVAFYFATLAVFVVVLGAMYVFSRSPLGVSLRGTRDQPRRMTTLGYNVWMIRFVAFLFSGIVAGVSGIMFAYYNKFVDPHTLSLTTSAEVLLMVISGGTGTLFGPIVGAAIVVIMKYVVSAYIERWNMVLGIIFVAIILFMPEGLVPGTLRLARASWAAMRPGAPAGPAAGGAE